MRADDNDDLKMEKEEKRPLCRWQASGPWGVPTPKIAIVLFLKYSHGFSIHCHDRFCHPWHGDDDNDDDNGDDNDNDDDDDNDDAFCQLQAAG